MCVQDLTPICLLGRGFIFTAPKRLLANSIELVCISLHNVTGAAHVSVDVLLPDTDDKIASTQHTIKNGNSWVNSSWL